MFLSTCLRCSMIQRLLLVAYWVWFLWLVGGGGDGVCTILFHLWDLLLLQIYLCT